MPTQLMERPAADEHAPYYERYVAKVPSGDLISLLREQVMDTTALLRGVSAERANYAYAPGKWSIKEVVGHMADTERVMAYRALRISRGDTTPLASFDENLFVANSNFASRTLDDLLEEFQVVRASTVHMARQLDERMLALRGTASANPVTVRALLYIIAGHERHHTALLRERYLSQ
ncbi:MAG TPA: DinB family protein [Gemmatimonadaceae bacterium]|nr:DinB family protein [Gemmatimonadaceae bacterium]